MIQNKKGLAKVVSSFLFCVILGNFKVDNKFNFKNQLKIKINKYLLWIYQTVNGQRIILELTQINLQFSQMVESLIS